MKKEIRLKAKAEFSYKSESSPFIMELLVVDILTYICPLLPLVVELRRMALL